MQKVLFLLSCLLLTGCATHECICHIGSDIKVSFGPKVTDPFAQTEELKTRLVQIGLVNPEDMVWCNTGEPAATFSDKDEGDN